MKQFLVSAFTSLAMGICFALGIAGVIAVVGNWDQYGDPLAKEPKFIRLPPEVRVVEHSQVIGTPSFTIRGVVENSGNTEWLGISIQAVIKAGNAQINQCNTQVDGKLLPHSRRAFQIECYGVAGSNLPDNIGYELVVRSARKAAG